MGNNKHHNDGQKRGAAGKPHRDPHGTFNRIVDSVAGVYGGKANQQNAAAKAGHKNGRKNRPK